MSQKNFRVSFDIPESKLGTVVGLVAGEVSNLVIRDTSTIPVNGKLPDAPKPKRSYGPRGGTTAYSLVRVALAGLKPGTEVSYNKVIETLTKNKYHASSHTSMISNLVKEGFIERSGHHVFRILKAVPNA